MDTELKLLIDGRLVAGAGTLDVLNPATGTVFQQVPRASKEQLQLAVTAARAAQPGWAAVPVDARAAALLRLADALAAQRERFATALVHEQGKPLAEALAEVDYAVIFLRHFAAQRLAPQTLQDDADYRIELHYRPLGVVAGIVPWNFPLLIACYKLAPALLTGNAFILKPAPGTPVTALMLGELAAPLLPAGVFNVLVDTDDLGPLLTKHPDIAKISFTGSTPTGRKVMAGAAATLKRLTLELGGNDAAIVLDDADVATVAQGLTASAFFNAGQVCIAVKRVYAPAALYERLCRELADRAASLKLGDGLAEGTALGPLQNAEQYRKAHSYLAVARRDGRVLTGGKPVAGAGYFVPPTVVRDIDDGSPLVDEEQFSPILPVVRYTDLDDALARANRSEYGLGASLWSSDPERARQAAGRLQSGTIWINHHTHFGPHIPLGGAKQSGLGVEFGREGLIECTQRTVLSLARATAS